MDRDGYPYVNLDGVTMCCVPGFLCISLRPCSMFKTTSVLLRIIQKSPFGISYTNNSVAVDTLSFCVSGSAQRICELDNSQTSINLASKWHRLDNSHLKSEYLESELSRSPYLIGIEPSNRMTIQMRFRDEMLEYEQS